MTKQLLAAALCIFSISGIQAQTVLSGLTGVRDTSYSNHSAYKKVVKRYPDIKLVAEAASPVVGEQRNIPYCTIGNRTLYLDAFYPQRKTKQRYPGILIIHGGGWRSGNRSQHIPLAQHLAKQGFACYTVEYRLSTEALYPAAIYDLKAALRWIKAHASQFHTDTSKLVALGFSAGGELAAFVGVTNNNPDFEQKDCNKEYSSQVQAIVDIDGTLSFVHPESGEGNDSKSISAATYWFGYPKKDNPELWEQASPLTYADKNTPPVLFLNSSVERMHAGRDDFRAILNKNGIYSEVHTFPNSPHDFCLFEPWFTPTVGYITAFLKKVFSNSH
ncbi:alpha/beta hydrolase [Pedobacter sp. BS3]|uniref:alpha/beta hydrolase n=1 Tax=Pedobacter sp. BS3 TaxID=2567937 RepID=UPI0011EF8D3C|nr:alpha/beta hydrolase [Pedobacter sp. BS3]TZF84891.1 alpha/beta hydrolase [Pedobacter sp. BS3]